MSDNQAISNDNTTAPRAAIDLVQLAQGCLNKLWVLDDCIPLSKKADKCCEYLEEARKFLRLALAVYEDES
jgi:hypothetical protein